MNKFYEKQGSLAALLFSYPHPIAYSRIRISAQVIGVPRLTDLDQVSLVVPVKVTSIGNNGVLPKEIDHRPYDPILTVKSITLRKIA